MIEAILPDVVVAVEAREDPTGVVLLGAEAAIVAASVEQRRREFATGRACAHEALTRLGLPASAVTSGERGEPRWPAGVVGSITHCDGYRACAIAHARAIATLGIDAEPHTALPEGVLAEIAATPEERAWLHEQRRDAPGVHWDRLLFSAKESVYKAWFPLAKRWLGFADALVTVDPSAATFTARLLVPGPPLGGPPGGARLTGLSGRWLIGDGLVLTAIALATAPPPPAT